MEGGSSSGLEGPSAEDLLAIATKGAQQGEINLVIRMIKPTF